MVFYFMFQILNHILHSLMILLFILLPFFKDFNNESLYFLLYISNFYINQFYIYCHFYVYNQILTCITKSAFLDNHCFIYLQYFIFISILNSFFLNKLLFLLNLIGLFLSILHIYGGNMYHQRLDLTMILHKLIFIYVLKDLGNFIFLFLGVIAEINMFCFNSYKCVYIILLFSQICI